MFNICFLKAFGLLFQKLGSAFPSFQYISHYMPQPLREVSGTLIPAPLQPAVQNGAFRDGKYPFYRLRLGFQYIEQ